MMKLDGMAKNSSFRPVLPVMVVMALLGVSFWNTNNVSANHPVLVEGNCNNPPAGSSLPMGSAVGTCGDYDGDGRIGTAEDTDGPDRVFGTINAALGNGTGAAMGTGANQNGRIIIVTSGTFAEVVTITGANGNVQLEAAPGVEANIDAVLQGDVAGANAGRQNADGIIVNSPANRYVQIRNITIRNWRSGILVMGSSRVAIESCRIDNNVDYGVEVKNSARVTVAKSEVHGTGFRQAPGVDNTPTPGKGIEFDGTSTGSVFLTTVSGSFAAGVSNVTGNSRAVVIRTSNVFDNNPNFEGISSF